MMRIPRETIVHTFSCDFLTKSDLNDIIKRFNGMSKDVYGRPLYRYDI